MKKLALTIAIVLGLSMTTFADNGGLFQRGESTQQQESTTTYGGIRNNGAPGLPGHGEIGNQPAPLGSGLVLLAGLGAAYLVGKKRREE